MSEQTYIEMQREMIERQYEMQGGTGCGSTFGELLCYELHSGRTFVELAKYWSISLPDLGALIHDHCNRLQPLPLIGPVRRIYADAKPQHDPIAALTPAPDAPGSGDGEIEIPEGFTKWDEYSWGDADRGKPITLLFDDGSTVDTEFGSGNGGKSWKLRIVAFKPRILSEPAGEGETNAIAPPVGYTKIAAEGVRCRCINLWTDGVGGYYCCNANTSADASKETDQRVTSAGYQHVVDAEPAGEVRVVEIASPDFGALSAKLEADLARYQQDDNLYVAPQHVVDAEPAPVLRADVPADATTYTAPSGELFATFNGQTHLVLTDPPAEQSEPFEMAKVEAEEPAQELPPLFPPEAPKAITPEDMEARGLVNPEASWWARKMKLEDA